MNHIAKAFLAGSAAVVLTAGFVVEHRADRTRKTASLETFTAAGAGNPIGETAAAQIATPEAVAAAAAADKPTPVDRNAVGGSAFRAGDKLKIMFYERVEYQDDKWKARRVPTSLEQRTELSGEFLVQDDGAISLPLLGRVLAAGQTAQELQVALQSSFASTLGHDGYVTIAVLERQPIYVLGPVKRPGAYPFAPGMTVLHAVALAGGLDRFDLEPWQQLEGVRETERSYTSTDHLIRSLAHVAVLEAERDGTAVQLPNRLIEIAGEARARSALNSEIARRDPAKLSDQAHESTLAKAVENGKQEIDTLSGRIAPIEESVKLKDQRASRIHTLASRNIVDNSMMDQVQSELLGAQERQQEVIQAAMLAKQRLSVAEQEKATYETDKKNQLEQEIDRSKQESIDLQRDLAASRDAVKVVQRGAGGAPAVADDQLTYQIVRRSAEGASIIDSSDTADLQPGDLVRLRVKGDRERYVSDGFSRPNDLTAGSEPPSSSPTPRR